MPRDWSGSVFRTPRRETYSAKWLDFETGKWRVTKGFATKADARAFVDEKRREYRARRRGDFDEFAEHRHRPIAEHAADFIEHLRGHRRRRSGLRGEKHSKQAAARLRDAFASMSAKTLADLTQTRVDRFLAKLLDVDGRAVKTRNDYAALLHQFARWAIATRRLAHDPLGLTRPLSDPDSAKRRQTLSWQQVRDLAAAAIQRALQKAPRKNREHYVELARRRSVALLAGYLAGLRRNELASARWAWFDLAARVLTVPADASKAGRTERVPLHTGLAGLLTEERRRRGIVDGRPVADGDLIVGQVVNGRPILPRHYVERLRDAARWVNHPAVDDAGRVLDLHSMRTSLATTLAELGVNAGAVSDLMRHRAVGVTEQHYVQRSLDLLRQAIDLIPTEAAHVAGLWEPREGPQAMRAGEDRCAPTSKAVGGNQ